MVDLRPGSAKLADRALRIIQAAGDVTRSEAAGLHREADGRGQDGDRDGSVRPRRRRGARRLAGSGGHVRRAVEQAAATTEAPTERPLG